MTLQELIDGVTYEIQGNIILKKTNDDGRIVSIWENETGSGIFELEVGECLDDEIGFMYATTNDGGEPALAIELE